MSGRDDIVNLQLLADQVADARERTEKLLARYDDLARRLDGLVRFSGINELRDELLDIANLICERLDEDPAGYASREVRFVSRLHAAGVPWETIFDALEKPAEKSDREGSL